MAIREQETKSKFLQLMFQDYYRANANRVDVPERLHMREFGMESWDFIWRCPERRTHDASGTEASVGCGQSGRSFKKLKVCPNCGSPEVQMTSWTRHLGYRSPEALRNDLVVTAPHSVYHSAAFYDIPVSRSMDEKGWQGAELVFDIDADHLDCSCSQDHDAWRCNNPECNEMGKGVPPEEKCTKCGSESITIRKWLCDRCLGDAKRYTLKLYDEFLTSDFGIDPQQIQLNYSGHRGYHVRVRDSRVFKLDADGRIEIIQYINGLGFNSEKFITETSMALLTGNVPGWPRKMMAAMVEFIRNIDSYDGKERWVEPLRKYKTAAIESLLRVPPSLSIPVKGFLGVKSWQEIAAHAVALYGGKIDVPVTHDIHRVIRLIGSLNGKTGFNVVPLARDTIEAFDPFKDALAFTTGSLKVRVMGGGMQVPNFRIGDEEYGPYDDDQVELPMAAAVFILCKGVATIE
jgi:DNA primase small subunit